MIVLGGENDVHTYICTYIHTVHMCEYSDERILNMYICTLIHNIRTYINTVNQLYQAIPP